MLQIIIYPCSKFKGSLTKPALMSEMDERLHPILQCGRNPRLCVNLLQWRHTGLDGVSNHQPHHCLLSRLFGHRSKKTSKLRVTDLCAGNSPLIGEFPAQMASNAENVSIWWRHHAAISYICKRDSGHRLCSCHDDTTLVCVHLYDNQFGNI